MAIARAARPITAIAIAAGARVRGRLRRRSARANRPSAMQRRAVLVPAAAIQSRQNLAVER